MLIGYLPIATLPIGALDYGEVEPPPITFEEGTGGIHRLKRIKLRGKWPYSLERLEEAKRRAKREEQLKELLVRIAMSRQDPEKLLAVVKEVMASDIELYYQLGFDEEADRLTRIIIEREEKKNRKYDWDW